MWVCMIFNVERYAVFLSLSYCPCVNIATPTILSILGICWYSEQRRCQAWHFRQLEEIVMAATLTKECCV